MRYETEPGTSHVERCDRGYVRVMHGERLNDGGRCSLHLASQHDESPAQSSRFYDSRCGWCYLNAPHSSLAHSTSVLSEQATRDDFDTKRAAAGLPAWRW